MLNSLTSRKKSDHSAVKFSYELNFIRHSRFISYLFTIHSQGLCISRLTEYSSIKIQGTDFYQITIHRAQINRITASRKYPCPPSNKEAAKFWGSFNWLVELTLPATIELCTQRYVTIPGLWLDTKVTSYDRILQSMCYYWILIAISDKYL